MSIHRRTPSVSAKTLHRRPRVGGTRRRGVPPWWTPDIIKSKVDDAEGEWDWRISEYCVLQS